MSIVKTPYFLLHKVLVDDITLKKVTKTIIDEAYGVAEETTTTYTIKGKVVLVTEEDLRFLPSGTLKLGEARGYFYPSYTIDSTTVTVEIGDKITINNEDYKVEELTLHQQGGEEIYREVILRK